MEEDRALEQELFRELRHSGDTALRDRLVEDHLWLARHCARRFEGRGEPSDDLVQVASLALVKAVDRFDPDFKVRFATFAVPTIVGELRRHFRDKTWSVRVSRRLKELHLDIRSVNEEMSHDLGRAPTIDELADGLGVSPEEVLEALEAGAAYRTTSLVVGPEGAEEEVMPGGDDDALESAPVRVALQEAMSSLGQRERRAVYLRFYLGLTQAEIAEQLGVSQVHVSRILRATLAQLGEELGEFGDEYP
jgi:RNA polymerase sigma-B factor